MDFHSLLEASDLKAKRKKQAAARREFMSSPLKKLKSSTTAKKELSKEAAYASQLHSYGPRVQESLHNVLEAKKFNIRGDRHKKVARKLTAHYDKMMVRRDRTSQARDTARDQYMKTDSIEHAKKYSALADRTRKQTRRGAEILDRSSKLYWADTPKRKARRYVKDTVRKAKAKAINANNPVSKWASQGIKAIEDSELTALHNVLEARRSAARPGSGLARLRLSPSEVARLKRIQKKQLRESQSPQAKKVSLQRRTTRATKRKLSKKAQQRLDDMFGRAKGTTRRESNARSQAYRAKLKEAILEVNMKPGSIGGDWSYAAKQKLRKYNREMDKKHPGRNSLPAKAPAAWKQQIADMNAKRKARTPLKEGKMGNTLARMRHPQQAMQHAKKAWTAPDRAARISDKALTRVRGHLDQRDHADALDLDTLVQRHDRQARQNFRREGEALNTWRATTAKRQRVIAGTGAATVAVLGTTLAARKARQLYVKRKARKQAERHGL